MFANHGAPFLDSRFFADMIETLPATDRMVVAVLDDVPAGFLIVTRLTGRVLHVATLGPAIAGALAGRGIGSVLVRTAIDIADQRFDLRRLELHVDTDDRRAIALHERFGVVHEGTLRGGAFRDGRDRDVAIMTRLRPPPSP